MYLKILTARLTTVCIAMLLFLRTFTSSAQEITPVQLNDTSLSLVQLYAPKFVFEQTLNFSPLSFDAPERLPDYTFQSAVFSPASLTWEFQKTIDIAAPWKLQLAKENEYRTLYMILGSVSTGGAVYIAYRHVKKYGFW